jgi:hypothetical protein
MPSVIALASAVLAIAAGQASAAVRTGTLDFNPNPPGPTFGTPALLPEVTVSVAYDDQAGTLVITVTGGDPSYYTGWPPMNGIQLSGPGASAIFISNDWDPNSKTPPTLSEGAVNGTLDGTFTESGTTLTVSFSDPALAAQNLTYVNVEGSEATTAPSGSFHLTGYAPTILLDMPPAQRTRVDTPLGSGIELNGTETGLAPWVTGGDSATAGISGDEIPVDTFTATGLPPGIRVGSGDSGPALVGKPTTVGIYTVTLTGTAPYNNDTQTNTGRTQFAWTITPLPPPPPPPLPKIPTFVGPNANHNLQVRPTQMVYSGDGAAFFAGPGRAGHRVKPGHLRWQTWTANRATGSGDDWMDNCTPDCVNGYRTPYHVTLVLSRPRMLDHTLVFTRVRETFTGRRPQFGHTRAPRATTRKIAYSDPYFLWS